MAAVRVCGRTARGVMLEVSEQALADMRRLAGLLRAIDEACERKPAQRVKSSNAKPAPSRIRAPGHGLPHDPITGRAIRVGIDDMPIDCDVTTLR